MGHVLPEQGGGEVDADPAARAMISSPAKRSQASALSCGVESRSSASVDRGSGRTTGCGPVDGCDSSAGGRPRTGRSRPVSRSRGAAPRAAGGAVGGAARSSAVGRGAGRCVADGRGRRAGGRAAARDRRGRRAGRGTARLGGSTGGAGGGRPRGRRGPAGARRGRAGPRCARRPVALAAAEGRVARRRPPRHAAGGCRSPRGRPSGAGGRAVGRLDAGLAQDLGERAATLCPGSSPVRPSRSLQRVQPAQDDSLAQRPRTDPHARYVHARIARQRHDGTRGNLVRARRRHALQLGQRAGLDPGHEARPPGPAPSSVSSRGTRSPAEYGAAPVSRARVRKVLLVAATRSGAPAPRSFVPAGASSSSACSSSSSQRGQVRPAAGPARRAGTGGSSARRPAAATAPRRGPRRCPLASSSEPPPMSRTSSRPALQPNQRRTARKVSRASSSPVSTCRSTPVCSRTRSSTSRPLSASRIAEVTSASSSSQPCSSAWSQASWTALEQRLLPRLGQHRRRRPTCSASRSSQRSSCIGVGCAPRWASTTSRCTVFEPTSSTPSRMAASLPRRRACRAPRLRLGSSGDRAPPSALRPRSGSTSPASGWSSPTPPTPSTWCGPT